MDFGYVVYGSFCSQLVILTNVGLFPLSFVTSHSALANTGFNIDLGKRVKALPSQESLRFVVSFNPAAVKCPLGPIEAVLPFQVISTFACLVASVSFHGLFNAIMVHSSSREVRCIH